MLNQLIYFSKAAWLMTDEDLQELLAECRRLNALHGITGMLLYFETCFNGPADGRFIQVIEGPTTVLERLFENIDREGRHINVNLLNCMASKRGILRTGAWASKQWHRWLSTGRMFFLRSAMLFCNKKYALEPGAELPA